MGPSKSDKWIITLTVMIGTIMSALDSSIVNVALPYMRGSLSATIEEIIEFGATASAGLDHMERSAEEIERLTKEAQSIKSGLTARAQELTKKRGAAAREARFRGAPKLWHRAGRLVTGGPERWAAHAADP